MLFMMESTLRRGPSRECKERHDRHRTRLARYAVNEDDPGFQPPAFLAPGDRRAAASVAVPTSIAPSPTRCPTAIVRCSSTCTCRPSAPARCRASIWIHGGAWLFGTRQTPPDYWPAGYLFQAAIDAGLAVASIDYRHSREASFPAQLHDAKAAIRYLRHFAGELGLDPERFGVWGESAGGHLAALVGLIDDPAFEGADGVVGPSSAVSAVVDFYGVSDVDTLPVVLRLDAAGVDREPAGEGRPGRRRSRSTCCSRGSPCPRDEARRLVSPVTHVSAGAPVVPARARRGRRSRADRAERGSARGTAGGRRRGRAGARRRAPTTCSSAPIRCRSWIARSRICARS